MCAGYASYAVSAYMASARKPPVILLAVIYDVFFFLIFNIALLSAQEVYSVVFYTIPKIPPCVDPCGCMPASAQSRGI